MSQSRAQHGEPSPPTVADAGPLRDPPSAPAAVSSGPVVPQDPSAATLFLMVGLPAAGKTTRATELAA